MQYSKRKYIGIDNIDFNYEEKYKLEIINSKKAFILSANDIKEIISTNKEINLYLTEKGLIDQPLYVFKLK